VPHPPALPYV